MKQASSGKSDADPIKKPPPWRRRREFSRRRSAGDLGKMLADRFDESSGGATTGVLIARKKRLASHRLRRSRTVLEL